MEIDAEQYRPTVYQVESPPHFDRSTPPIPRRLIHLIAWLRIILGIQMMHMIQLASSCGCNIDKAITQKGDEFLITIIAGHVDGSVCLSQVDPSDNSGGALDWMRNCSPQFDLSLLAV